MADAAVSFEDPAAEDFGQDIVVHGNKPAAPQPTMPAIGAAGTNAAAQPAQPAGISFDDFFGTKPKAPPANDQGTAPAAQQSATPAAKGISFDDFFGKPAAGAGPLANTGDESYLSGLGKGAATAAIKGLADIPGFAGNIDNLANYLIARGEHAVTGEDLDAIIARHAQRNADFAKSSVVPMTAPSGADISGPILSKKPFIGGAPGLNLGDYVPESDWGRAGQAGLEGAIAAFAPGGAASPSGAAVPGIAKTLAKQAPMIGGVTAAGQEVTDVTHDPLLGAAAGIVAGSALGGAGAAAAKIGHPALAALPDKIMGIPLGRAPQAARETLAGRQLAASAKDLPALRDTLNGINPENQPFGTPNETAVVPGSKPTLGQLSGDQGILMKEREARTEDVSSFNEREAQQNTARKAQIEGQAKSGADVMRVPQTFRDRLNHIDKATQQAIDTLTQRAKNAAAGLGKGETAEQRGSSIRTSIEAAKNVARAMKTRLYDAVDPEEKLNLVATPVREKAEQIAKSLDALDEQPEGREAAILSDVRALPDVMPFKSLRALDKRVTTAMKVARRAGEDTIHRRLSMLKGAVQDAIDNGVENQVKYETEAVSRGEMKPDETIGARLASEAQAYAANKESVGASRVGNSGDASGGSPSVSFSDGAKVSPRGRSGNGPGAETVPNEALSPNFDAAAADSLTAAKDFYKNEYAPTFKEGPVAKVLAGPFSGKYNVMDSAVPSRAILKGDRGYETAKAFIKASGKAPEAVGAMADHILDDLRDGLLPIGAVSPSKFAKWKADYAPALRALDEQMPGFSDKFSSAARATDTMMEAGRLRETAIDQFQKGAAGQFLGNLGKNEPVEVENAVGKILSDKTAGPTRMEALVKEASRDPEAVEGLKKAGVDWILRHFSTTAEAGTSGEKLLSSANFQKFVSENRATIQKLYGSEGLGMFAAVAHDLERANRPISATRIGGSPGTAHDVAPIISSGAKKVAGHTSMMVAMVEGVRLGYEHGGMKGAALAGAGGAASYLLGTLRHAGMNKVNGLVRDALLNPDRARVYLSKVPVNPDSGKFIGLASAIRRQLIGMPINLEHSKDKR